LASWRGVALAQPVITAESSSLEVGVAIDAVIVVHHQRVALGEGEGLVDRPLPEGATLVSAEVAACDETLEAAPQKAKKLDLTDAEPQRVVFPVPSCAAGGEVELTWTYVLRATQRGARFSFRIPSADIMTVNLAGGGSIWSVRSETHRVTTRYEGETIAHIKATGPAADFALTWELAGPDAPQVNTLAWVDSAADGGCLVTAAPPSRAAGADPIVLYVVLDRDLSSESRAKIDSWYRNISKTLAASDRVNFAIYDGADKGFVAGPRAGSALMAAEAVAKDAPSVADLIAWQDRALRATPRPPSLPSVVGALRAESTPSRWRRIAIVFGGAPDLAAKALRQIEKEQTPIQVIVIGDGPAADWPAWVDFRLWDGPWSDASKANKDTAWPASVARPHIGRLVVGPVKGGAALGDLWPSGVHRWAVYHPKSQTAAAHPCFGTSLVHVEAEVGEAWLVEDVSARHLEAGGLPHRAAATLARLGALRDGQRLSSSVKKVIGGAFDVGALLAWPIPAFVRPRATKRAPKPKGHVAAVGARSDIGGEGAWRGEIGSSAGAAIAVERSPRPRVFKVKTIRSRVGGRSGTQLRDRLDRHRRDLEAALGHGFPRKSRRASRVVFSLQVIPAGAVKGHGLVGPDGQEEALPLEVGEILGRLTFDPLTGGDGDPTRFLIELDLR